jgi:hypothetical protein
VHTCHLKCSVLELRLSIYHLGAVERKFFNQVETNDMKKIFIIAIAALMTQGCATPYQEKGFAGGFSETQLDENVYTVSFKGNGFTSREKATDYALMRSAQLALQGEYKYFVVMEQNSYTQDSSYTTPITSNTTANAYGYGNSAYGNATTTSYGGQTFITSKPNASMTIICFKEKPENAFSYNAEFIYGNLSRKYGIQ